MSGATGDGHDDGERLKELGHLSAAVGHNVINAFSAMVSNAELIRSHAKDPNCDLAEIAALGAAIIENALSASQVPRRLIDMTRRVTSPGFDQVGDPPALIDLNQLIRDTVEAHSRESGGSVEWRLEMKPIPMIRGNAPQLRSLLGYLIRNARDAMPRGQGAITFATSVDARNWVVLEVRDDGCGMSSEVLKRATEPFFTTRQDRTGMGLTVAHGIWRRHRGALSIESQPGVGTTIRLAVEAPMPADPPPPPPATLRSSEQSRPSPGTRAEVRGPVQPEQPEANAKPFSTAGDKT